MQAKFCKIWVVLILEQHKRESGGAPRSYKRLASFRKITAFFIRNYRHAFYNRPMHSCQAAKKKSSVNQS